MQPLLQFPNLKESPMKMIKAVKKLKFWSKKKRKKKTLQEPPYYYPPPPCHCSHSSRPRYSIQPSAPPLPPWSEPEQQTHHQAISAPVVHPVPDLFYSSQAQLPQQEIVLETSPLNPTLPATASATALTPSYQQYMVPNPVYGMPVVQTARRERPGGLFGCVINFGINLIRCFCPCFRIREVY